MANYPQTRLSDLFQFVKTGFRGPWRRPGFRG